MKKAVTLLLVMVLAFSLAGCGAPAANPTGSPSAPATTAPASAPVSSAPAEPIKIGAILPLTGPQAELGEYQRRGIEVAIKEQNAAGGLLGRQIELVAEDAAADTTLALNVANLLVEKGVCASLGPATSTRSLAVMPIFEEAQIPWVTVGTSPAMITAIKEGNKYMFMGRANDSLCASIAAKYINDEWGAASVGVVYTNDDFGIGGMEVIKKECESYGITVYTETYNKGDTDMTGQLLNLKNKNVESMVLWSSSDMPVFVRQTYELGIKVPVIASVGITQNVTLSNCEPEWLEGWMSIADFASSNPEPNVKAFVDEYAKSYSDDPEAGIAYMYTMTKLVLAAIEKAGSADPNAIRDALATLKDVSTPTDAKAFCDENNCLIHQTCIVQLENLKPVFKGVVRTD